MTTTAGLSANRSVVLSGLRGNPAEAGFSLGISELQIALAPLVERPHRAVAPAIDGLAPKQPAERLDAAQADSGSPG